MGRRSRSGPTIASNSVSAAYDLVPWYAGTRARVEARATLEQVEELRQVLEELGEQLGEYG